MQLGASALSTDPHENQPRYGGNAVSSTRHKRDQPKPISRGRFSRRRFRRRVHAWADDVRADAREPVFFIGKFVACPHVKFTPRCSQSKWKAASSPSPPRWSESADLSRGSSVVVQRQTRKLIGRGHVALANVTVLKFISSSRESTIVRARLGGGATHVSATHVSAARVKGLSRSLSHSHSPPFLSLVGLVTYIQFQRETRVTETGTTRVAPVNIALNSPSHVATIARTR